MTRTERVYVSGPEREPDDWRYSTEPVSREAVAQLLALLALDVEESLLDFHVDEPDA